MKRYLLLCISLVFLAGCPVTQPQDTPVDALRLRASRSNSKYWVYVPSYYNDHREWPLVVTLHGTHGFDGSRAQIKEWKALAEEKEFIVVAPDLKSVQGILPVIEGFWMKDLERDEKAVLDIIDELAQKYRIDEDLIMLTGFSAGGYPLYYIGLRNFNRFDILIARACNTDLEIFEKIQLTEQMRKLPIFIYWGKDDPKIRGDSWEAYRWLREHRFFDTERDEIKGGHLRRPEVAYEHWLKKLKYSR